MKTTLKIDNLTPEKADFIVRMSESFHSRTIEDREILNRKANILIGIVGSVLSLFIGVLANSEFNWSFRGVFLAVESTLLLGVGIWGTCTALIPTKYVPPGIGPEHIVQEPYVGQETSKFKVSYALKLQDGTRINSGLNAHVGEQIKSITMAAFISFPVAIIVALIAMAARGL